MSRALSALLLLLLVVPLHAAEFDARAAQRFADLALACVHKEYPNKISHNLNSDADVAPPRKLTPAFYGCYDWHSSVHGHWLLARLARTFPDAPFTAKAREALAQSITPENIAQEVEYLRGAGRASFERLKAWLPKLSHPIRIGEHSQSAFGFGLILDSTDDQELAKLVRDKSREFFLKDRNCPLAYEPSGEDFLSPCIAEADLMRRILPKGEYAAWLTKFLPSIDVQPEVVTDPTDGKLAHLDGLNLSRAWMLEGIASGLPAGDPRVKTIRTTAAKHRQAGLAAVTGEHYEGGHWLGSFAVYLTTQRGLK